MQKDFSDSYRSTQWQEKKNKILTRDNYTCAICGKHGDEHTLMHVHHLTYKNCKNGKAWDCPDEDLVTLCEDCHAEIHSGKPFASSQMNFAYLKGFNENKLSSPKIIQDEPELPSHFILSARTQLMGFHLPKTDNVNKDMDKKNLICRISIAKEQLPFIKFAGENIVSSGIVIIVRTGYGYSAFDTIREHIEDWFGYYVQNDVPFYSALKIYFTYYDDFKPYKWSYYYNPKATIFNEMAASKITYDSLLPF